MKKQLLLCGLLLTVFFFPASIHAQWSSGFTPYGRDGNSVYVLSNSTAAIAGGNESNDSIRSVFMTNDRANNWGVNLDVIKSWLRSVTFSSDSNGVAAGYDGAILKTTDGGITWNVVTAPGNTYSRHFNSVCMADSLTGYIAGGWPADDSIQTILKTTDGGSTWTIQSDNLGYWLRSISFSDPLHGMAVGDHGTILHTTDGGTNWLPLTVPGNAGTRNYQCVYMLNSLTALIVGGNPSNDSIQTILKTTDGGSNWSVVLDAPGPMLKSIDFAGVSQAYIVGNRGVILHSMDKGDSWSPVNLPFAINDTMDLNAVNFYNADFGIAVGRFGKMLIFDNPLPFAPTTTTLQATNLSDTSATLQAEVNANGSFAAVNFEYGITPQLGTVVAATPDTVFGNTPQTVVKVLTGLLPNTIYYYRVKTENEGGNSTGNVLQFFTGGCDIPNCSFEIWDSIQVLHPSQWTYSGTLHRVPSYNGSYALQLGGAINYYTDGSAVILGNIINEMDFVNGVPISGQPDSLTFYAKYDIVPGDTAFALAYFKQNSQPLDTNFFPITGSTGGNFVYMAFPIDLPNSTTPDSAIIGFINTNAINKDGNDSSILIIDEVRLSGTNGHLANWDFEQWDTDIFEFPAQWNDSDRKNGTEPPPRISKTTDRIDGDYALRMQNSVEDRYAFLSTSYDTTSSLVPSFSIGGRHDSINFYLKYAPVNNDTLFFALEMFKADSMIGNAFLLLDSAVSAYTRFSIRINYYGQMVIPDSASMRFNMGGESNVGSSVLYLDALSFDGLPLAVPVGILPPLAQNDFRLYPNPAQGRVEAEWNNPEAGPSTITFTDINGRSLKTVRCEGAMQRTSLDISELPAGFYIVSLRAGHSTAYRKLMVSE